MLLSNIFVDGGTRNVHSLGVELLSLPDKVLDQVALVLGQQKVLGLGDNFTRISDQCAALGRELLGGV